MINVDHLNVFFGHGAARHHAVKDIGFTVEKGSSFGLVGESGSGKTTVLNCISGLLTHWQGRIDIDGAVLTHKRDMAFCRKVQMVFQDPYGSLHPRHTIDRTLTEPVRIHRLGDAGRRVARVLDEVGLGQKFRFRFPHQLSGGQRQRVAIARALILEPEIILLDEPTSALDVSIQAEVLNLLQDLQREKKLTYILVSHDLAVVCHMCDTLLVMNRGKAVETLTRSRLKTGSIREKYTAQLLVAGRGYDRTAIDQFKDFG